MKELFFGWIIKGQYELSLLDSIISYIELIVLIYLIYNIVSVIKKIKEKIKKGE